MTVKGSEFEFHVHFHGIHGAGFNTLGTMNTAVIMYDHS